ncbi:hypothetical protein GCM10023320_81920 [Pseudonocardia adelaidensis]|uniref:Uncharacterized protein n=1 Tax=Pseudonocardia adelaidensis TaxID=648754 RepID=A0ABP9P7J2_9PSEU
MDADGDVAKAAGVTIAYAGPTVLRVLTTRVSGSARWISSARLDPGWRSETANPSGPLHDRVGDVDEDRARELRRERTQEADGLGTRRRVDDDVGALGRLGEPGEGHRDGPAGRAAVRVAGPGRDRVSGPGQCPRRAGPTLPVPRTAIVALMAATLWPG